MSVHLPYELTKSIEGVILDPEVAKKVIRSIEEGLLSIENKAKEQKIVIKNELKDELTKELVTKDELKATEERLKGEIKSTEEKLRGEIKEIRGEIKATEEKLRGEIKDVRGEIKDVRGEIKDVRGEIKDVRGEIKATEERLMREIHKWRADTIKWMFIFWIGQIAALTAIIKLILK
ncbi:hypothetical protein JCM12298_29870 [Desulfothermus naphthae]